MAIKIQGLRELDSALKQFSKSTARGVLQRTLRKAAQPIADEARANAPFDTGELRDSINVRAKGAGGSAGKAAYAAAMRAGASRSEASAMAREANIQDGGKPMEAVVSVAADAPHAVLIEFGTQKSSGTMFLSAAMDSRRRDVINTIGTELKTEIAKTAKRVAARAAKKGKK